MYGPPMSGKTLAASCVGLVTGMNKNQISSRNTQAFLAEVFVMSSMPFLWDDPTRETEVRQVCIDLGNAAFRGKFKEDAKVPLTGCLVTANFNLAEIEKYYSRISLIPFKKIDKVNEVGEGPELERKAMAASSALPTLISLANNLKKEDITETVTTLRQDGTTVDLRVIDGVAVPYFMAHKILQTCGLGTDDLSDYCRGIVVRHQKPTHSETSDSGLEETLAAIGKNVTEVLKVGDMKIYIRVGEFCDLVGEDLSQEIRQRGTGTTARFMIDGQNKVRKCVVVTDFSERELSLAIDLNPPQPEDHNPPQPEDHNPPGPEDHNPHQPEDHNPPGLEDHNPPQPEDHNPPGPEDQTAPMPEDHTLPGPEDHTPPGPEDHTPTQPEHHTPTQPEDHTPTQSEDHILTQQDVPLTSPKDAPPIPAKRGKPPIPAKRCAPTPAKRQTPPTKRQQAPPPQQKEVNTHLQKM